MKKSVLDLGNFNTIELHFDEMMLIDGGGFWKIVGGICAVALIVVCAIYVPALLAVLL